MRIRQIDALRGIAAMAVVLFHYITQYPVLFDVPGTPLNPFVRFGGYGVDLFFMISGFVILMTADRTADMRAFLTARFARLYPAYWAATLLTFAICRLAGPDSLQVGLLDLAANATMLQGLLGFAHVDGAYWSLQVEWLFYVSFALLAFAGPARRSRPSPMLWLSLWLAAAILTQQLPWPDGPLAYGARVAGSFLALKHIHLFIVGAAICLIWQQKRLTLGPSALIGFGLVAQFSAEGLAVGMLTVGFAAAMLAIARDRLQVLAESRILVFLGGISYSLYLVHQHNGYVIIQNLTAVGCPRWLAIIVAVATAIGTATILNRLVEEPAARYMRLRMKKFKAAEGTFVQTNRHTDQAGTSFA